MTSQNFNNVKNITFIARHIANHSNNYSLILLLWTACNSKLLIHYAE